MVKLLRKIIIIGIILLMVFSMIRVGAEETGSITINGTTSTEVDKLAIIEVHATSQNPAYNIKGSVNYDKSVFTIVDVEVSDNLYDWNVNVNTDTLGTISFNATNGSKNDPIASDRMLFKVRFIVIANDATTSAIKSSGFTSTVTVKEEVEVEDKENILNQAEIDEFNAKLEAGEIEEGQQAPTPQYGTKKEEKSSDKTVEYTNANYSINIKKEKSSNTYLKSLTVSDKATLYPSFSKLTNSYKVTIDPNDDLDLKCIAENPTSKVTIQQEVNNQILINVSSEDGSSNAYVLTIVRQKNYDSTNPVDVNPSDDLPDATKGPTAGLLSGYSNNELIIALALASLSLVGFIAGSVLIYKGSRE